MLNNAIEDATLLKINVMVNLNSAYTQRTLSPDMPSNRFDEILRFIRVANNEALDEQDQMAGCSQ